MDHTAESAAGDSASIAAAVVAQWGVEDTDGDDKKLDGDADAGADDEDSSNEDRGVGRAAVPAVPERGPASVAPGTGLAPGVAVVSAAGVASTAAVAAAAAAPAPADGAAD